MEFNKKEKYFNESNKNFKDRKTRRICKKSESDGDDNKEKIIKNNIFVYENYNADDFIENNYIINI